MKKFSLSSCLTKLICTIIVIMGFIYGFSLLFPRAYYVLEGKVLGIKEDTVAAVVKPPILNVDTLKPKQVDDFKYAIKLEHKNNCYYIPTKVNGIPMKMLIDTGASNLCISVVEYEFLRKQELLNDTIAEVTEATIANGETVKCYNIKIAEIQIGDTIIKDVDCTVMEQQDAPVLLGMNVLKKLGNFSIDYKRNLLITKF